MNTQVRNVPLAHKIISIIFIIAVISVALNHRLIFGHTATSSVIGSAQSASSFTVTSNLRNGFDIVLATQPTIDSSITISSSDIGAATAAKNTLTFTPQNWNLTQTLEVIPVIDADNRNELVTFTFTNGTETLTRVVQVNDTISGGLLVSPATGITVANGAASANLAVSLEVSPTAPVTINASSSAGITNQSFVFTPLNYSVPQLLKFDPALLEAGVVTVTFQVDDTTSASEFMGLNAIRTITVTGGVGGAGETTQTPLPTITTNPTPIPTKPVFGGASPDLTVSTTTNKTSSILIRTGGAN